MEQMLTENWFDLGESVEKSEDGLTYTFKIKDGLVWSDGVPLTAEHFVYGIKRAIGYGPDMPIPSVI